jgi:hypothetical protein
MMCLDNAIPPALAATFATISHHDAKVSQKLSAIATSTRAAPDVDASGHLASLVTAAAAAASVTAAPASNTRSTRRPPPHPTSPHRSTVTQHLTASFAAAHAAARAAAAAAAIAAAAHAVSRKRAAPRIEEADNDEAVTVPMKALKGARGAAGGGVAAERRFQSMCPSFWSLPFLAAAQEIFSGFSPRNNGGGSKLKPVQPLLKLPGFSSSNLKYEANV